MKFVIKILLLTFSVITAIGIYIILSADKAAEHSQSKKEVQNSKEYKFWAAHCHKTQNN